MTTGQSKNPHWLNQLMTCDCADSIHRYQSPEPQYHHYLWQHSFLSCIEKRQYQRSVKYWQHKPLISIQLSVFKVEIGHLQACLDSVTRQLYPHWQLCIVEDGSGIKRIKETLTAFKNQFPDKVKLVLREENRGITTTSQEAFLLTEGEYVALLDHDDYLAPEALYEAVKLINQDPKTDWIYSDNDKIDANGQRCCLHTKPAWSPDLLLTYNYILHLSIIRRSLLQQAGGFRSGFEGSQDHDLYLRLSEISNNIKHIPRVLYSWRQSATSVALDPQNKTYAYDAALRAIDSSLKRRKETGYAIHPEHSWLGSYQIIREIAPPEIDLVFLNPDCDQPSVLNNLALQKNININKQSWLEKDKNAGLRLTRIIQNCRSPYLLFLSSTVQFGEANQLLNMAANLAPSGVVISTAKIINHSGQVDHCGLAYHRGVIRYPLRGWDRALDGIGAFGALPRNTTLTSPLINVCDTQALKNIVAKLCDYQETSAWFIALGLELQAKKRRIVVDGGISILTTEEKPNHITLSVSDKALLNTNYPHFFNHEDPLYILQMNEVGW